MPFALSTFGVSDMLSLSLEIPKLCSDVSHLDAVAQKICRFLYDELRDDDGNRACALVRCYKTHPFDSLTPDLQVFARGLLASPELPPGLKCLTLLGTAGDLPEWNTRLRSRGHRAIPLPSPEIVEKAPMIAQLIREFGLDIRNVLRPSPELVRDLSGRRYGVFHVENALGNASIPAQADFVERYGVKSVLGFGGILPTGDLFAVILFTRVRIASANAQRFRAIALDVKSCLSRFGPEAIFA